MQVTEAIYQRSQRAMKHAVLIGLALAVIVGSMVHGSFLGSLLAGFVTFIPTTLIAYLVQSAILKLPESEALDAYAFFQSEETSSSACPDRSTIDTSAASSFLNNNIYTDSSYNGVSGNSFTNDHSRRY